MDGMPCFKDIYNWINGLSKKDLIYTRKPKPIYIRIGSKPRKEDSLSIDDRPEFINNRLEVEHYEIDLVILSKNKGKQLLTLTDRYSRHEIIRIVKNKTAEAINKELSKIATTVNIKSITSDKGSKFLRLDEALDCPIY